MVIGIVINQAWNIYNFRRELVQSLLEEGHDVVAVAPHDHYSQELKKWGCRPLHLKMENKGANPLADLWLLARLWKIYRRERPDVLLHFTIKPNIYGTLAARILGIPCVNNVTGLGTVFIHENLTSRVAHSLYRFAFRFPRVVFFQNGDDRELFAQRKLVRSWITDLLPGSGVDLSRFSPAAFRRGEPFTFLMVARLLYDKGIVEYVEAAKALKAKGLPVKLRVLGSLEPDKGLGPPKETVDEWHAEGLIEYLGRVDDVRPVVAEADAVVLPSYREGTPRTLLEGAAMGKPIVASDVPGCRETVEEGYNGFLFAARDAQALADSLERVFSLKDDALQVMGRNSRKLAEDRFDHQIVVDKYKRAIYYAANGEFDPATFDRYLRKGQVTLRHAEAM